MGRMLRHELMGVVSSNIIGKGNGFILGYSVGRSPNVVKLGSSIPGFNASIGLLVDTRQEIVRQVLG
jgi:hypothetical protein